MKYHPNQYKLMNISLTKGKMNLNSKVKDNI